MSVNYRRYTHDMIKFDPEFESKMSMTNIDRGISLLCSMNNEDIKKLVIKYNKIYESDKNKIKLIVQ